MQCSLVSRNRIRHGSPGRLEICEHHESIHIVFVELSGFLKRLQGFFGLLIAKLQLAEQNVEQAIVRRQSYLLLSKTEGLGQLIATKVQICETVAASADPGFKAMALEKNFSASSGFFWPLRSSPMRM